MAKKNKDVIIGNDAREALAAGISKTVEAVQTFLKSPYSLLLYTDTTTPTGIFAISAFASASVLY